MAQSRTFDGGAIYRRKRFLKERLLHSWKLAALGEHSASIAHEINNPLAIIRQEAEIMGQILKGEVAPNRAELQESVRMIIHQMERCADIIRNLLDFARKREPVLQVVNLNRIVEDMTRLVEKEARNDHIAIKRRDQRGHHYSPKFALIYEGGRWPLPICPAETPGPPRITFRNKHFGAQCDPSF